MWTDLNPARGGTVYADTFPGRFVVTWNAVPEYPQQGSNTLQVQLFNDGRMITTWQSVANLTHTALVGFTVGNGPAGSLSRDLSASVPFSSGPAAPGLTPLLLAASNVPAINHTFTLVVSDIPASAVAGVLNVGFTQLGIDLTFLGMASCSLLTTTDVAFGIPVAMPSTMVNLPIPNTNSLAGGHLFFQAIVIAPGQNPFGVILSNGVDARLGF
jgi:hypothetical protein